MGVGGRCASVSVTSHAGDSLPHVCPWGAGGAVLQPVSVTSHAGDSLPHVCPWGGAGGAVLQPVSVASHKLGGPTHGR